VSNKNFNFSQKESDLAWEADENRWECQFPQFRSLYPYRTQ